MAAPRIDVARRLEIESIFENAIERPTADRWDWVAEQCGTDRHLRAEVQALIAAHERTDGVLELEITGALLDALDAARPFRRVGAYRLVRELGRGGMGVVFLAERMDTRLPALDDVRDAVRREWSSAQQADAATRFYQALLRKYAVSIEAIELPLHSWRYQICIPATG